jgi:hypothetical protein
LSCLHFQRREENESREPVVCLSVDDQLLSHVEIEQVTEAHCSHQHEVDGQRTDPGDEITMIPYSNTDEDPLAVVVVALHALIAHEAVPRVRGTHHFTGGA